MRTNPKPFPARHPTNVLQRTPTDPLSRLAEEQQLLASGRAAEAEAIMQAALGSPATRAEAHYLLAIAALMRNRPDEAVGHAREATSERPAEPRYQFALGRALKQAQDLEGAAVAYRCAIELQPAYADAHVSLGIVLKAMGDLDAAINCHELALAFNPQLAVAHANLAIARGLRAAMLDEAGSYVPDEAHIEGLQRAVALDPHDPELHRNLGLLLQRAGRHEAAARAFNDALTRDPSDLQACLALGNSLVALGGFELARQGYEKWLGLNRGNAEVMRALASALARNGEADAALGWAEKSLELEPHPVTELEAGSALIQLRRVPEGLARCRRALDTPGADASLYPVWLFGSNYLHEDPAVIRAAHAEFGALAARPLVRLPKRNREPGDRLRVGYVSGDFVRHSVAFFIEPLLEQHDKSRFDVVCYQNNPRSDAVTQRLQSHGHRWVECAHLSDEALAKRITADGIDILIDLAGPTAKSRILMFAMAPAPVQIGYLGYPTITGVASMDYRITDAVIDPREEPHAMAAEYPLRLLGTMFCYRPDEAAPALAATLGERDGTITFGSFNSVAKITDHTLDLWASAMRAVPQSRLLLKAPTITQASVRVGLEAAMAARGITADRLMLRAQTVDDRAHLALYCQVDIALDTFPYNGATTTCEALWMGVPVVTRRGLTHTSLMGASLLRAIDRQDWVSDSDEAFVSCVVALASDVSTRAHWRLNARTLMSASGLMNSCGFARHFEALLEHAWRAPVNNAFIAHPT